MLEQQPDCKVERPSHSSDLFSAAKLPSLAVLTAAIGTLVTGCDHAAQQKATLDAYNIGAEFFRTNPPGTKYPVQLGAFAYGEISSVEELAKYYGLDQSITAAIPPAPANALTVYVRLSDESLLQVEQRGEELFFSKNATGYGEKEGGVKVPVIGGSVNTPQANLYTATSSYLEVLAYVDYDWKKIADAAEAAGRAGHKTVDPALIERTLKPLAGEHVDIDKSWFAANSFVMVHYMESQRDPAFHEPGFVKLKDGSLLKVTQNGDQVEFYRNWSGYSKKGGGVEIAGYGIHSEVSVNNLYTPLTAKETIGLFDGKWEPIVNAIQRQAKVVENSVSPSAVYEALVPNGGGPLGGRKETVLAVSGSAPKVRPSAG